MSYNNIFHMLLVSVTTESDNSTVMVTIATTETEDEVTTQAGIPGEGK